MPKILKLKKIDRSEIKNLKCRGIKSSMGDPITVIQKILDKLFNHVLHFKENEFVKRFRFSSPTVTGVKEAGERIRASSTGKRGSSIEIEGDFSDLYSNCNEELLKKHLKDGCKLAGFSEESVEYIDNLVFVEMNRSYFHEPEGIFRTTRGFSMGDNAAARGSEIILRGAEFSIFERLSRGKLLSVVKYLRFRDDVSIHLSGNKSDMLKAIKIISTGYPNEILLNMETNVINGKFLNYRVYNQADSNKPFTTILRKKHCKYNIIPSDSNTLFAHKLCA